MSESKVIQFGLLSLFIGEFIAMSCGLSIVPKDPEVKQYFYSLHAVFLTILSVPSLAALVQNDNKGVVNTNVVDDSPVKSVGNIEPSHDKDTNEKGSTVKEGEDK